MLRLTQKKPDISLRTSSYSNPTASSYTSARSVGEYRPSSYHAEVQNINLSERVSSISLAAHPASPAAATYSHPVSPSRTFMASDIRVTDSAPSASSLRAELLSARKGSYDLAGQELRLSAESAASSSPAAAGAACSAHHVPASLASLAAEREDDFGGRTPSASGSVEGASLLTPRSSPVAAGAACSAHHVPASLASLSVEEEEEEEAGRSSPSVAAAVMSSPLLTPRSSPVATGAACSAHHVPASLASLSVEEEAGRSSPSVAAAVMSSPLLTPRSSPFAVSPTSSASIASNASASGVGGAGAMPLKTLLPTTLRNAAFDIDGDFDERVDPASLAVDFEELATRAGVLKHMGRLEESLILFKAAERLVTATHKPIFYIEMSDAYLLLSRFEEAIFAAEKGLVDTSVPDHIRAGLFVNKAEALHRQGRIKEAAIAYKTTLILNPDFVLAHIGLGSAFYQISKEFEARAVTFFDSAFAIMNSDPSSTLGLNTFEQEWVREIFAVRLNILRANYGAVKSLGTKLKGHGSTDPLSVLGSKYRELIEETESFLYAEEETNVYGLWSKIRELNDEVARNREALEVTKAAQAARDAEQDAAIKDNAIALQEAFSLLKATCAALADRPTRAELADVLEDAADKAIYRDHIATNPKLLSYYNAFMSTFNQTFAACFVQGSGRFEVKASSIDLKPVINLIPFPIAKEVVGLVIFGVNKALEINEFNKTMRLASLAHSITSMEQTAAKLTLKLALLKAEEIISADQEAALPWYKQVWEKVKKVKGAIYHDPHNTVEAKLGAADAAKLIADCMLGKFNGAKGSNDLLRQFIEYYAPEDDEAESDLHGNISAGLSLLTTLTKGAGAAASALGADSVASIAEYVGSSLESAGTLLAELPEVRLPLSTQGTSPSHLSNTSSASSLEGNNLVALADAAGSTVLGSAITTVRAEEAVAAPALGTLLVADDRPMPEPLLTNSASTGAPVALAESHIISSEKVKSSSKVTTVVSPAESKCCPKTSCVIMAVHKIIYDNDALNHPELLARAAAVNMDLYHTVVNLGAEGYNATELSGLVSIYE